MAQTPDKRTPQRALAERRNGSGISARGPSGPFSPPTRQVDPTIREMIDRKLAEKKGRGR